MKKVPVLFILNEYLDCGREKGNYWHFPGDKPVLRMITDRLQCLDWIGEITLSSDAKDSKAKEFTRSENFQFHPFEPSIKDTIPSWGKKNSSAPLLLLFYCYSPVFDLDLLTKAFIEAEKQSFNSPVLMAGGHNFFCMIPPESLLRSQITMTATQIFHKQKADYQAQCYRPFNSEVFLPLYALTSQKIISYDYINGSERIRNLPYIPGSYHGAVQAGQATESNREKFHLPEVVRMVSTPEFIPLLDAEVEKVNLSYRLLNMKERFGFDMFYEKLGDIELEELERLPELKSRIFLHAGCVSFQDKSCCQRMFKNRNIAGLISGYSDDPGWEEGITEFLEQRRTYFQSIGNCSDWSPKVGIEFDIEKLGPEKFSKLSRKWDLKGVILEKFNRNMEESHFLKTLYTQNASYPEHIIIRNRAVSYFGKRFLCKHLQNLNMDRLGNFYLCPRHTDIVICTAESFAQFGNSIYQVMKEKAPYLDRYLEGRYENLSCAECNQWYDLFQ
ncbi:MAG: hypothetical protein PHQ23_03200 [Candidatus Wallbacteria bacterium]|nr:hypothetical protein [Candidatus Wallbacteria bacterium]